MTETQKFQTKSFRSFKIEVWNLFGNWILVFEIWNQDNASD